MILFRVERKGRVGVERYEGRGKVKGAREKGEAGGRMGRCMYYLAIF